MQKLKSVNTNLQDINVKFSEIENINNQLSKKIIGLENTIKDQERLIIPTQNLTDEEIDILTVINSAKSITSLKLSEDLHINKVKIRNTLNELIWNELIKIDQLKNDKDQIKVSLTKIAKRSLKLPVLDEIPF